MRKKNILRLFGKILGTILLSLVLFLLFPFLLRNILDQLFLLFGVPILISLFTICSCILFITIFYYGGVQKQYFKPNKKLEIVFSCWKNIITVSILSLWGLFIIGFSPSAYWLREYNFWIGTVLIIVFVLIAIAISFSKICSEASLILSKVQLVTFISAFVLFFIIIFPYYQSITVTPIVSSEETLDFNLNSDLVPLRTQASFDIFLNDFDLVSSEMIIQKNIDYNNYSSLDVYYIPHEDRSNPILIVLHGGGWISGSKNIIPIVSVSKFFAIHGFTVFSINYRLFPEVNFLEMLHDVRDAIFFAKKNASTFYGDKNKTFMFGRSSGAQLALVATYGTNVTLFREKCGNYNASDLKILGVASIYGISEVSKMASRILGVNSEEDSFLYDLASPIRYINRSGLVPTFIAAGTLDALVPVKNSRLLQKALQEYNNEYMYVEIPWANHAYDGMVSTLASQVTLFYFLMFFSHYA